MVTTDSHDNAPLQSLNDLKHFHVSDDSHDIRGWKVVGKKNDAFGVVNDLIVDTERGKARYLTVTTDKKLYANETERQILVPVGRTRVEGDHKAVVVDSLDREKVRFYPVYTGEPITRDYEYGLKHALRDDDDTRHMYESHHMHSQEYENKRHTHKDGLESDDPLVRARAERDVAKAERDIYKSRYEMLQHQLRNIRRAATGKDDDEFYNDEDYNDASYRDRYTHT
ncbi:PRC-barrel domain-containing protein [Roseivirga sp. BDSF3-8]|uniref:PRC-barrel domain-containing protein n=1 Tax=Roseivirga sp. BDSF3-8 TaxID=3241598 RepID=UPI0035318545